MRLMPFTTALLLLAGFTTPPPARAEAPPENLPPVLSDDSAMVGANDTLLSPLANDYDPEGQLLTLVSVSEPAVSIRTRDLLIPGSFTGTFTYQASDGTNVSTATVTVTRSTARISRRFSGLLYSADGTISGWVRMAVSPLGSVSLHVVDRTVRAAGVYPFGRKGGTARTTVGALEVKKNADGTMIATLNGTNGPLTGLLRSGPVVSVSQRHHVALGSIGNLSALPASGTAPMVTEPVPGGGYAVVYIPRNATATMRGKLPDGTPFTAGTVISDVDTLAFYVYTLTSIKPRGYFGGQLTQANLSATDSTGEFVYVKPQQTPARGAHPTGITTIVQANGSLYTGMNLSGLGTLRLSGGGLAGDISIPVTLQNGRVGPADPLQIWSVQNRQGSFLAKFRVAGSRQPFNATGIYLSKTQSIRGYFGGGKVGGRVTVTMNPPVPDL